MARGTAWGDSFLHVDESTMVEPVTSCGGTSAVIWLGYE